MKLVILGAGASFDNINFYYGDNPDLSWRPPLANEIFDARDSFRNLIKTYPGADALMSELNNVSDIEEYFQGKWNFVQTHRADEILANLINIQYFLSDLFHKISLNNNYVGNSNYDVLIQHAYEYSVAKKEEVAFVSFNYDLLFEQSIKKLYNQNGKEYLSEINDYINKPIKLFKMHGACNWYSPLYFDWDTVFRNNGSISSYLYANRISYADIKKNKGNKIEILRNPIENLSRSGQHFYFPELLVPFKDKDEFILPDEHLDVLKTILPKVTDVMIIGWKGSEEAFKRLLNEYIGDKEINVLSINGEVYDSSKKILPELFSKGKFTYFNENFVIDKYDNSRVNFEKNEAKRIIVRHGRGSFSSYTLNVIQKQFPDFFKHN